MLYINYIYLSKARKESYVTNKEKKYKYIKPILASFLYAFLGIKYLRSDNSFALD